MQLMHPSFSQQPPGFYSRRMTQVLHLPLAAPQLVDREQELSYLTQQLGSDGRLLTLVGPAGVGKTHLAIHVALRLQDSFERIVFVDLSATQPQQFTQVLLRALELTDHPAAHRTDKTHRTGTTQLTDKTQLTGTTQLAHELSAYKTLLVLDSFETVLGAAPILSELLAHCPSLYSLVTSRSPLGLRFEKFIGLQPFTAGSAFSFFVNRAKTANPPYALESYQETIAKLCERLDGLPLALELAAACTAHMTPEALLAHLNTHPSLPRLELPDRPERHQNLGLMIDSSVSLLSEREQHFFRRLSVIAGSFSVETAAAITDAGQLDLEALSTLIKFRNYGLLSSELTTPPRFKMLETAKAVALASLRASSDTTHQSPDAALDETTLGNPAMTDPTMTDLAMTRTRHLHHYHMLATEYAELFRSDMLLGLELFLQEQENMCAALHWSLESQDTDLKKVGVRLAVTSYTFWHVQGHSQTAHTWLEAFRGTYSAPLQAIWLWALASTKILLDDNQEGITLAKEALRLAYVLKDKILVAKILTQLGGAHRNLDHFTQALEYSKEACKLAKEMDAKDIYTAALNNTALVYHHLGQPAQARIHFEEALQIARSLKNLFWQALCTNNLALLVSYEERVPLLQKSLELMQKLGDSKRLSLVFINLTDTHYHLGQFQEAQRFAEKGLAIAEQASDRLHIALNFNNLGLLTRQRGDIAKAEHYFSEALAIFQELGVRSREAEVLSEWARCYHTDPPRAAKQYLSALGIALETNMPFCIAYCLDGVAELELIAGRPAKAVLVWSVAKRLWERETSQTFLSKQLFAETKLRLSESELQLTLQKGAILSPQQLFYDLSKVWGTECKRTLTDVLSLRQQDILKLVAQGYSNKKIAKVFEISEPTVKYHLREAFDKLGVNSRTEAVTQASQRGLLGSTRIDADKTEA